MSHAGKSGELLNVALIGYGFVGKVFHAPLIRHTPGLLLHTVVSSDSDKVLADLPEMHVVATPEAAFADPDIDLIVIATPNATHAALAHAALDSGKHVVVDKPFTLDLQQARDVIAHAASADRLVSVFQNRRWDADFLCLQQLLAQEALGEVAELHSHFDRYRPQVTDRWRESDQPGSGLWYDLGPHLLDQAVQLFGMPLAITVDITRQREGGKAPDYFHVLLRYPSHRVVLHAGSLVSAHGLRFAVHGTSGSYMKYGMDAQEDTLRAGGQPGQHDWGKDQSPGELHRIRSGNTTTKRVQGPPGDYRQYYAAMRDAILLGGAAPVTPLQALQVMALLEWGMQSSDQRREIDCQEITA